VLASALRAPRGAEPPFVADRVAPATIAVDVAGQRFQVGAAGDRVAVGDWSCTGQPTPALLRPATGAVFVFDRLAAFGERLAARRVTSSPGAVDIEPGRCGTAVLRHRDGQREIVATTSRADSPTGQAGNE